MSQSSLDEPPTLLNAAVEDVRYLASLLRGVHFSTQMAIVTLTESGLTVTIEEARTLVAVAFIFSQVFDEFDVQPPTNDLRRSPQPIVPGSDTEEEDELDMPAVQPKRRTPHDDEDEEPEVVTGNFTTAFQINLNVLVDCMNIFGTAGPVNAPSSATHRKWTRPIQGSGEEDNQNSDAEQGPPGRGANGGGGGGQRGLQPVKLGGQMAEKKTSVRMTYNGDGYPLTLLVTEESGGPTATCEIATYQTEPHLSLEMDSDIVVLRIILKSSWLRDAISEIDPSCEKLTFIANPPLDASSANGRRRNGSENQPRLRIRADGTFGSTEIDYPNDKEVLETFDCRQRIEFSYRFSHITKTLRALSSSTKTSMRVDEDGLLSLQFLMPKPHSASDETDGFVEFRVRPHFLLACAVWRHDDLI